MPVTYRRHPHRPLQRPVAVVALEGWIDAGFAAAGAGSTILGAVDPEPLVTFDSDELLDHRARRPILNLVDGVSEALQWPQVEMHAGRDANGRDLVVLAGAEPDHVWRAFTATVVDLFVELDVQAVVHLGAYPAPVPHTRPSPLSITAATTELALRWPFGRGSLQVPAGVQAAIEREAGDRGLDALGLWAQVPHYVSGSPYPAASIALLQGLTQVTGLVIPVGDLPEGAAAARASIDEAVQGNPEHVALLRALEQRADAATEDADLPSGDELAAEVERFLRDQGPT